ncbi:hexameric tyrosine-coordinated heme protein [Sphingomonas sp. BK235]|uniref:hexameric tyrosine-coordinated heme protein n=1 Tax=Sphingomonas sp. BK235 TaxID=2512131 RepID=UPI001047A4EC|nr:hexameric tyrosine-coordinated heme protein [Sphingomonas sp. BK235]TCP36074.1 hexameric tyrosine-coordinated heme protein (HTHP) [Sphingomonas sp. BK235]
MDRWLGSLLTQTPEEGYQLAIKLSRTAIKMTQPSPEARERGRHVYEESADSLIRVSHVVATNFATVAAANDYWRFAEAPQS